jgi:pSer/pThr/pTyr-binding forkhead associated (FHA) protein
MQDLRIIFASGPMAGESSSYDLGSLLVGREPNPDPDQRSLTLRGADGSVSRNHALIFDRDGDVVLQNSGTNGTSVNGKLILEEARLKPGDTITIGANHEFKVDWQLVGNAARNDRNKKEKPAAVTSTGPLRSPLVRTLLVVYLLGIVAVALWFSWRGGAPKTIGDDWPELGAAYEAYEPANVDAKEKARRTRYAEAILVRLRVLRANERDEDVRRLCRELMRLDSDILSPLYRYGARCLGSTE